LTALLRRVSTEKPKPEDVKALQEALKKYPDLWRVCGDLGRLAESSIIGSGPKQALVSESVKVGVDKLRDELGHSKVTALERILIDQVVLCKLQLDFTQFQYARVFESGMNIVQADYWERRLTATQKRYLRAVETLARVRRLLRLPTVQINVGAQQVNVTGDVKRR
jgi:hypothetical protein